MLQNARLQTSWPAWWTTTGFWKTPPTRIDVVATGHTPMSNVAAVISTILTAPDNGIIDGDYNVLVNDGLVLPDNNVDSVAGEELLSVGLPHTPSPTQACTTSADCPAIQECMNRPDCSTLSSDACRYSNSPCSGSDCICRWPHQARWKYVVTHEAGHQIQERASGSWAATDYGFLCPPGSVCPGSKSQYTKDGVVDPPWTTDLCGCEHVNSANREHCLQSIERSASAQVEGIGHTIEDPKGDFGQGECVADACPVGNVNWFEAASYANLLSEKEGLEPCYVLKGCKGTIGVGYAGLCCDSFEITADTIYACKGYRLPTGAEWEYAARAGAKTAFYNGDITTRAEVGVCVAEPALDAMSASFKSHGLGFRLARPTH